VLVVNRYIEGKGENSKATKTIQQPLGYQPEHAIWFAATKVLFNQVAAFYFDVIQAHPGVLDLDTKAAQAALERLTRATKEHPHPVMQLTDSRVQGKLRNNSLPIQMYIFVQLTST
jgi:hypothetical protein